MENQAKHLITIVLCILIIQSGKAQSQQALLAPLQTKQSGNFKDATTWLLGVVPLITESVTINPNHIITLNANQTIGNIELLSGSTLDLSNYTLTITGDFKCAGTLKAVNGTLKFSGIVPQNLELAASTTIKNITTTNITSVKLAKGKVNLTGTLTLSAGTFYSENNLTIVSTNTATGRIATIPSGVAFSGNLTMQRYVASGVGRYWWHLSSPVKDTYVSDWQNEILITGGFTNPSTVPGSSSSGVSLKYYNESVNTGDKNSGWVNYPSGVNSSAAPITTGRGYSVYIRDTKTSSSNKTIDVTGTPNTGTINFNITYTSSGVKKEDGWNFVGNPYPSDIDWSNTGWTKNKITNAIYVWDADAQKYSSFVDGVGTNGGTGRIASGQAFWVKAQNANPSLIANENVKTATATSLMRKASTNNLIRITMSVADTIQDEAVIRFTENATLDFDDDYDAYDMGGSIVNIASVLDSGNHSINSIPYSDSTSVALYAWQSAPGKYKLQFSEYEELGIEKTITLLDTHLDSVVDIRSHTEYEYTVDTSSMSKIKSRFKLVFQNNIVAGQKYSYNTSSEVEVFPNPITGNSFSIKTQELSADSELQIVLMDGMGKTVFSETLQTSSNKTQTYQVQFQQRLTPGLYHLILKSKSGNLAKKVIIS